MADGPCIREWASGDAAAIAAIHNQAIEAGNATMEETLETAESTLARLKGLGPKETVLVLEDPADGVVGWGIIKRYSDREGYRHACETSVYIDRDHLRAGLGSRMKLALIERCKEWGYHHLVAKIFAENEASIRYNLELGYERVGVQREIGKKNGRWRDVAILQMTLDEERPKNAS